MALLAISADAEPIWQRQLVIFDDQPQKQGPWRDDTRLAGLFHDDYPDDLQVLFPVSGDDVPFEVMWVAVLDYDEETDTYLGKLLNQPNFIDGLLVQENVVFGPTEDSEVPVARSDRGSYRVPAIPEYALRAVASELYEGVRAYRLGDFGHNMPEIERCLSILENVSQQLDELSPQDAYVANFVRGRCAAEAYETVLAIDSFNAALAIRPDDFNSNMALLAELSVAALSPDIEPKAKWEAAYVQHWQRIEETYPGHPAVTDLRKALFDENSFSRATPLTAEELERGKRLGFGIFRWKQR